MPSEPSSRPRTAYAKTNAKWRYLADQMSGVEGATLVLALTGRHLDEGSGNLTDAQRRLASISDSAVTPAIELYLADSQLLSELDSQRLPLGEESMASQLSSATSSPSRARN